jgi:hypothetical protein
VRSVPLAILAALVVLSVACSFSSPPQIGDKDGYCSVSGSVKSDNSGKWSCEPDDPNSIDTTKHWVKVG